jgi:hypothetical protein
MWTAGGWISKKIARGVPSLSAQNFETALLVLGGTAASFAWGRDDLVPFARRIAHGLPREILLLTLQIGLGLWLGLWHVLPRRTATPRGAAVLLGCACTVSLMSQFALPGLYPGLHLSASAGPWIGVAVALERRLARPTGARLALFGAVTISALLFGAWGTSQMSIVTRLRDSSNIWLTAARKPWFLLSTPPTTGRRLDELSSLRTLVPPSLTPGDAKSRSPTVIVITVDALRADLFESESHRHALPNLFALRDRSVWFTQARSNSSATGVSLAALFLGKYFSELRWLELDPSRDPRGYGGPIDDPTARMGDLLKTARIGTGAAAASPFLATQVEELLSPSEGIQQAFSTDSALAPADAVLTKLAQQITASEGGGLFYAHRRPREPGQRRSRGLARGVTPPDHRRTSGYQHHPAR